MSKQKQYQFRAPKDLENALNQVWNIKLTTTQNLHAILWVGINALKEVISGKHRTR